MYVAKAGGFFFMVFGVIALMAAFFQINPIWKFGPYDPAHGHVRARSPTGTWAGSKDHCG